jgi:4-hydroxyphenylpyruvate dioxygenase
LSIRAIDFVEFRCGNAISLSHLLTSGLGFTEMAERNPLIDSEVEYLCRILQQGNLHLAITSAAIAPSIADAMPTAAAGVALDIASAVYARGDTVNDIAFTVPDVDRAFRTAVKRGARAIAEPADRGDANGVLRRARIAAATPCSVDLVHTLIERQNYHGVWAPGYKESRSNHTLNRGIGVIGLHSVEVQVPHGYAEACANSYVEQFGFAAVWTWADDEREQWALSGEDGLARVQFSESKPGSRGIGVAAGTDRTGGATSGGAQPATVVRIRLTVRDIVAAAQSLIAAGIETTFSEIPPATAKSSCGIDTTEARKLGIITRRRGDRYELSVTSRPIGPRVDSLSLELIETRLLESA